MKRFLVIAFGRDRPDIVAAVTKVLYEHDCNIEDSCMSRLQDEFTIMMIISTPGDIDVDSFWKALERVESATGLSIRLEDMDREAPSVGIYSNHIITIYGSDKPGIIYRVSAVLAKHGVRITNLQTKIIGSDEGKVYIMLIEAAYPTDAEEMEIEDELRELGEKIGSMVQVKPLEPCEPF